MASINYFLIDIFLLLLPDGIFFSIFPFCMLKIIEILIRPTVNDLLMGFRSTITFFSSKKVSNICSSFQSFNQMKLQTTTKRVKNFIVPAGNFLPNNKKKRKIIWWRKHDEMKSKGNIARNLKPKKRLQWTKENKNIACASG